MGDLQEETAALLEEKPDLEEPLRRLLAVDDENATWTFEDVPLDSGAFGEVVARGIVERTDDGQYEVVDPSRVRAAMEDDVGTASAESDRTGPRVSVRNLRPEIDRWTAAALLGALTLVVAFRLPSYPSVFRDGAVVLPANDPYFYRYSVEQLLAAADGGFDPGLLATLPDSVANGEPLFTVALWLFAALLGPLISPGAALAWFPLLAGVVSGILVYALAVRLTDDVRVGLAAVALLAVTPVHATRTGVGFVDHHAFDYVWLSLTAYALVVLVDRETTDRRTWAVAGAFGVGLAGQTLAWEAGPLLLVPVGIFLAVRTIGDVRADRSPLHENSPIVVGMGLAAVLVALAHAVLGWHSTTVAAAPALLSLGSLGLLAVGHVVHRTGRSWRTMAAAEGVALLVAFVAVPLAVPAVGTELRAGLGFLLRTEGISETRALFTGTLGGLFAPAFWFGFGLFLALPFVLWLGWKGIERNDPWAVPAAYAWFFFVLSLIQIRFAGELSPFVAVFGGYGFVRLAAWIELTGSPSAARGGNGPVEDLPLPGRRDAMRLGALSLGVGGLGALLIPIEHGQLQTDDAKVAAAERMRAYAAERDLSYPGNYVFSRWPDNRMYNYFVSGESRSYGYAEANFEEFVASTDPEQWYDRLADRAGFVVTEPRADADLPEDSAHARLHGRNGDGLGHYQRMYASEDSEIKAFALVPGATVAGQAEPGVELRITTEVSTSGPSFTYERTAIADENGRYEVRVPYPGQYVVGGESIRVPPQAVETGEVVDGPQIGG